jgi:hypothetical protein
MFISNDTSNFAVYNIYTINTSILSSDENTRHLLI